MPESMIEKGNRLLSEKKYEDSLHCYELALDADPDSPWACIGKAEALRELGRLEEALAWYDKTDIMALGKLAPWGYYKKSYIHYMLGNPDRAIAYMDRVLELDPSYRDAWFGKGAILSDCYDMTRLPERAEEAVRCYDRELEAHPDSAEAMYNKGLVLEQMGKRQETLECFDGVIRLWPDRAAAYIDKGNMLSHMNRYDDAMACYDRALGIEPDSASALYNKSRLLYFLDRVREAAELLEKATAINPNLPDLDELRKMLKSRMEFSRDIHKKTGNRQWDWRPGRVTVGSCHELAAGPSKMGCLVVQKVPKLSPSLDTLRFSWQSQRRYTSHTLHFQTRTALPSCRPL